MSGFRVAWLIGWIAPAFLLAGVVSVSSADNADLERRLKNLELQNQALMEQLQRQQETIDRLSREVQSGRGGGASDELSPPLEKETRGFSIGKVHIGGEGGLGFFHTGSKGQFSNSEFRVDEAKLFVEAPIWRRVYFFGELDLVIREREPDDDNIKVGELYVDFENVSALWNQDNVLSIRLGRMDIPFGEEYLTRDVIDNPLISHSLSDLWGIDEGIEFYGKAGRFDYVLAIQNGGRPMLRDYNSDKAVTARLGYRPANWVRLSASAMRTGALDVKGDRLSEIWFGNGFFRPLGSAETTTRFDAVVVEGDAQFFWPKGYLKTAFGYADMDDNDITRDNHRSAIYYFVEPMQMLTDKFYAAARFSQIIADDGYPLVGHGAFGPYFFGPFLTENIWRMSFGLGYRWSENLVLKVEYTREERRLRAGQNRESENFVAAEVGLRF